MTKHYLRKGILFIFVLLIQISCIQLFSQVTISGGSTVNGSYPSIANAVIALNGATISGPVIVDVAAGHSETAPVGGIILTATGTSANPITIQKSGAGANPLINAYVGVSTPTTTATDGIFILSGSDYVTIDAIDLLDGNIVSPLEMMECGYGLFKVDGTNGCQNNTIKNCNITLNNNSNATWTVGHNGSCGIVMMNSTYATKSALTVTAATGSNSNNKFYTNTISKTNAGIVFIGFAAVTPFTLGDTGNDVGGTSSATGNMILNFGGALSATNPATGIFANNQWGVNIAYNTINNNTGTNLNHVSTLRGIFMNSSSTSASADCNFNNITVKSGATTSQLSGIENGFGSTAAGNTINIKNNTITGDYLTATSGLFYGIYNTASPATLNINNNTVTNFNYSSAALTGSGSNYLIYSTGAAPNANAISNTISNYSRTGNSGGTTIGIYFSSGTNQIVKKNTINNLVQDGTGSSSTLYGIQTTTGTIVCDSNMVSNLKVLKASGTGSIYGFYNLASPTNENYNFNTIFNLNHSGTGSVYGIHANTTTGVRTVSFNIIYNITTFGTTVVGISQFLSTPAIFRNKIYDLYSYSTGAPTVSGIQIGSMSSGIANISNNLIGNLYAPSANTGSATSPSIRGINITSTTSSTTLNLSYNTVYINAQSTGTNFGTTDIYATTSATSTSAALTLNNNNFVNLSNPKGFGKTAAYTRSSTTLTNYVSASDRNNFYTGGACVNRLIYWDGTNADSVLSTYKPRVAPKDANSITENPFFLSTTGSSSTFLHIDPAKPTLLESGGAAVAGITVDYDGDTRNTSTPDIGADEFSGTPAVACSGAPEAGSISATPNPLCGGKPTMICASGQTMDANLTFQWKIATSCAGPFTDVACAKDRCLTTDTLSSGSYFYKLFVTCITSGITDSTNCLEVVVNAPPVITITPTSPITLCKGDTVTLSATGGTSYTWSPSAGLNTTSGAIVKAFPTTTTSYTVTSMDAAGCIGTNSVTIIVVPKPTVAPTAIPNPVCIGGTSKFKSNALIDCTVGTYQFTAGSAPFDTLVGATAVIGNGIDDTPASIAPIGFNFI